MPPRTAAVGTCLAMQDITVDYVGRSYDISYVTPIITSFLTHWFSAHAGSAPWEGKNALDAAFLAYANISALRQQMRPDERVHGIMEGKDWAPNGVLGDCHKLIPSTYSW